MAALHMVFAKTFPAPGLSGRPDDRATAEEEAAARRWREIILKLSDTLREAADQRSDFSLFLMEALHNALENLLLLGQEADLIALEEWLDHENSTHAPPASIAQTAAAPTTTSAEPFSSENWQGENWQGEDRRQSQRRAGQRRFADRRFTERRVASHFRLDEANGQLPTDSDALDADALDADAILSGDSISKNDAAVSSPQETPDEAETRGGDRRREPNRRSEIDRRNGHDRRAD